MWKLTEGFNLINSGAKSIYLKEDYEKIYKRISDSTGINVELDIIFYISFFYAYLNVYPILNPGQGKAG
jgi:hypothetical protein